jgi:predicted cupin superfamily sugar epimerase
MKTKINVEEIIEKLGLVPLKDEGGMFFQSYKSDELIKAGGLPERFKTDKSMCTAIYYLLTSDPDSFSALHKLPTDEIYHFYLGDPVELLELHPDGSSNTVILGSDILSGQKVQHVVKRGGWQGSRLVDGGDWALLGTTMAPGYSDDDFILGSQEDLLDQYPDRSDLILKLTS